MPKRSAQSRIERYEQKIRKLMEKEKRRKTISPSDSSSDSNNEGNEQQEVQPQDELILEPTAFPDPLLETDNNTELQNDQPGPSHQDEAANELDPDILSALGDTISDNPEYGENIHDNLSKLWMPLLSKGLPKESKEKILRDYLIPENCKFLQSPKLNAEISAAIPDMVRNRDKSIALSQQQLGQGITAINRGLDMLLKSDDKIQAMKHLSNACRILCDSHKLITNDRVKLITPSLDRSIVNIIKETDRDENLFGSSLSDKIKAAKAIEKQSLQIKKSVAKPKPAASQTRPVFYQGNGPAPPRYLPANRGGRGVYRRPQQTTVSRRPYQALAPQSHRAVASDKSRAPAQTHR